MTAARWAALLALALACGNGAWAQVSAAPPPAEPCPADTQSLPLEALFGRWELRIDGQPGVATVEMTRHPEYAGVRGTVTREGAAGSPSQLAGDIDDEGLLTIDQSDDGHAISATWSGSLQAGACGKVFEGTWRRASDAEGAHFVLRKLPAGSGTTTPTNRK